MILEEIFENIVKEYENGVNESDIANLGSTSVINSPYYLKIQSNFQDSLRHETPVMYSTPKAIKNLKVSGRYKVWKSTNRRQGWH